MKRLPVIALIVLIVSSIVLAVMPHYLVSPIRSQTTYDLHLTHTLTRWTTTLSVINLVVGLLLVFTIWRRPGRRLRGKIALAVACVILALSANSTRGYLAEGMFTPLEEVIRIAAGDATHVLPEDLVLGVKHGGEAAAYPVPIIAYHHIANDRLAGEPYVATY